MKGEYPFHAHKHEHELFFCWKDEFILDFEGGESVVVGEGECIVRPQRRSPPPRASEECDIFLFEPQDVKNSGDADVDAVYDAPLGQWV